MNWDRIEGRWKRIKGRARECWGEWVGDDIDVIDGRREQLAGRLQQKRGLRREERARDFDELQLSTEPSRGALPR